MFTFVFLKNDSNQSIDHEKNSLYLLIAAALAGIDFSSGSCPSEWYTVHVYTKQISRPISCSAALVAELWLRDAACSGSICYHRSKLGTHHCFYLLCGNWTQVLSNLFY